MRTVRPKSDHHEIEHPEWRKRLYVPDGCGDDQRVGDYRVTEGQYEDGEGFVLSDYWRSSKRADRELSRPWKGTTTFKECPSATGHGAPNSAARWLTPRGPGIPKAQGWILWADCETSEDEGVGELARRSPAESSDESDAIRPLESRI